MTLSYQVRKLSQFLRLGEVVASRDVKKMGRYLANKVIGKAVYQATKGLFRRG